MDPLCKAIEATRDHVREQFASDATGHDWWHIWRVRNSAVFIARDEGADVDIVELATLLHDIADWKFHDGDEAAGPRVAGEWLSPFGLSDETVAAVVDIVGQVSFKGAGVETRPSTLEGQCVQDADRLDALGAVGISRVFAYGGHVGQPIHDPDANPSMHDTFEQYKASRTTSINHFHEKLLLLTERMNTASGRRLAAERHRFMVAFLERFELEWSFGT
jgi:uncharacterized protein